MKKVTAFNLIVVAFILMGNGGCEDNTVSASGISRINATVATQANGLTVEQENVKKRLEQENKPGTIKHLYVISAMSGQVIMYSTVKGKVTSSGKRLAPYTVSESPHTGNGFPIQFGDRTYWTQEVLQDDGTYGHSIDYLYWWDVQGRYHQLYPSAGTVIQISDQPLSIKGIVINLNSKGE